MKDFFDLQLFTEGDAAGAGEGEIDGAGAGDGTGVGETGNEGDVNPKAGQELKYSDADLDRIIGRKVAELNAKATRKAKAESEAQRLAKLSAQERQEQERAQLQRQVQELLQKERRSEMAKTARSMLKEQRITVDDELLSMLISEDAESTKASIESFTTLFQNAVQTAVKDALKGTPPKSGSVSKMSKTDIMNVQNRAERQQLIRENIELFK